MEINGGSSSNTQYGVEKLVGTNYRYWRMCMEAFLQGQDLWELVSGVDEIPADTPENADSPKKIWDTLERLFSKKNIARLQFLENELAMLKQEGMSISEHFLRVKNICAEISELDPKEKISDARL
uniref:DUF4219 domain-containing protein n=1 Tax=Nelumbo nucifera TaxID=4432 RepID=A0A822XIP7_NELNU|nr:TPA_asm: hypothetical protein HUJ06_021733 [Nelumbo nucifera]